MAETRQAKGKGTSNEAKKACRTPEKKGGSESESSWGGPSIGKERGKRRAFQRTAKKETGFKGRHRRERKPYLWRTTRQTRLERKKRESLGYCGKQALEPDSEKEEGGQNNQRWTQIQNRITATWNREMKSEMGLGYMIPVRRHLKW